MGKSELSQKVLFYLDRDKSLVTVINGLLRTAMTILVCYVTEFSHICHNIKNIICDRFIFHGKCFIFQKPRRFASNFIVCYVTSYPNYISCTSMFTWVLSPVAIFPFELVTCCHSTIILDSSLSLWLVVVCELWKINVLAEAKQFKKLKFQLSQNLPFLAVQTCQSRGQI